jgi:hypothetical protein
MHWSVEINTAQVNEPGCETNMAHFSGMMMIYTLALFWEMMMWWHSQRAGWQTSSQRIQPVLCVLVCMFLNGIHVDCCIYITFCIFLISCCISSLLVCKSPVLQWYQYNNYSNCLWILSWYHRNCCFSLKSSCLLILVYKIVRLRVSSLRAFRTAYCNGRNKFMCYKAIQTKVVVLHFLMACEATRAS